MPSLIANGLLSYKEHYQAIPKVFYGLDFTVLLLCFMFLSRIKNPEQLKHVVGSEFGKLLGIDRVPEAKCLRNRLSQISEQKKTEEWMNDLFQFWLGDKENEDFFFYVDGHKRYNQLMQERNQFINILKMICYRGETSLALIIPRGFKKRNDEKRAFIKSMIKRKGDIIPDYVNKTITVKLYTMRTPRENRAMEEICNMLNDTQTLFPGTDMRLIYKFATV